MNELKKRDSIADAVSQIARAYLVIHLELSLGRLNILPDWIALLMIHDAIKALRKEKPETELLMPLAIGMAVWDGICEVTYLLLGVEIKAYAVDTVVSVLALYFHFQLLTNIADIARERGCPQVKKILTLRTVRTLLVTALALPLGWDGDGWLHYAAMAAHIVVAIWLCAVLFSLRKSLGWQRPPRPDPPKQDMPPLDRLYSRKTCM